MKQEPEIRKCAEPDIARVSRFYDDVILWLNDHINYPQWIYRVYPCQDNVCAWIKAGVQYICEGEGRIFGAIALTEKPQGDFQKANWSRNLSEGAYLVINALAVDPRIQRRGTGSAIIRFCIEKARAEGYKAIRVDIVPTNVPARRLFEKNGFTFVGDVDLELKIGHVPSFSLYEFNL